MVTVTFHAVTEVDDSLLKFAVIAARYQNQWVLCRHKARSTWEIPGGHREPDEPIDAAARRELWEETGAVDASIEPVCIYNVRKDGTPSYGMLYFAEIFTLDSLPEGSEIGEIRLFETLPENLTYPAIQPHLHRYILRWKAADHLPTQDSDS